MKLVYRGVKYSYNPNASTIATVEGEVIGHYRGVALHNRTVATQR